MLVQRITFFLALSLLFVLPSLAQQLPYAVPEDVGMSSERLAHLDELLQGYVDEERLGGAVLVVARDGYVVYEKAFGTRDGDDPLETDDLFRIASQTKAIVSVGIMMLQERGELLISESVSKYIPEFAETTVAVETEEGYEVVPAKRSITLKHLLTHTSGIGYGGGIAADRWKAAGIQGWYFADRSEPIGSTVERMAALPIDAQPGEAWVYGYNTDILGVVIERVTGMSLAEFLETEILAPLHMNDTHFYVPRADANRLSAVFAATDDGVERAPDEGTENSQGAYLDGPRMSYSGGAGLISTAGDYARFLEMMRRGGELDGVRLLSPKTVDFMTTNHLKELTTWSNQGFGLGFSVLTDLAEESVPGTLGRFGWGGAYHSTYFVDPAEELVVSYMTNIRPATGLDDRAKIEAIIYGAIVD